MALSVGYHKGLENNLVLDTSGQLFMRKYNGIENNHFCWNIDVRTYKKRKPKLQIRYTKWMAQITKYNTP